MKRVVFCTLAFSLLGGCATESFKTLPATQTVAASSTPYTGMRVAVSIGKFENRTQFHRGVFSDGVDRLGNQSKTILKGHLNQSGRFSVLDRESMTEAQEETKIKKQTQQLKGADFLITGDVTEFGRKEVGDQQLFGILGRGKEQVAYAKVTINVIDVKTSEVIFTAQGAGEFALSNREIIGFGGNAAYDSTLNGKVLDLAIRQAVDSLAAGVDAGSLRHTGGR